jgi:hypothetical protein
LLILIKHYPATLLLRLAPCILWAQILWALLAIRKGRLGSYFAGLAGFARLLPRAIRHRTAWRKDEAQALLTRLADSERQIFADVFAPDRLERDTFWRLYFALFPPRRVSKAPEPSLRTAP